MNDHSMNSRAWQLGMVLMVVLTCGMFAAAPPLIRVIWLDDKYAWWVLLASVPFVAVPLFLPDVYVYTVWAIYLVGGSVSSAWLYRPRNQEVR